MPLVDYAEDEMKLPAVGASSGLTSGDQKFDVVAQPDHTQVAEFAALWWAKRDQNDTSLGLPRRDDFSFEDLMPWMGHVIIMDVIGDADDFRYRMIGTGITSFLRRDLTGQTVMDSDYSGARGKVFDTFRRPLVLQQPVFRFGYVAWAVDMSWRTYHSVHCPISRDGSTADMTIGVLYFGDHRVTGPNGMRWKVGPAER